MRTIALTTLFAMVLQLALFAGYFAGPNPITPSLPLAPRTFLVKLPQILLAATIWIYITLPQAILLWTEPDMEAQQ